MVSLNIPMLKAALKMKEINLDQLGEEQFGVDHKITNEIWPFLIKDG
jgi:hypothetical protein